MKLFKKTIIVTLLAISMFFVSACGKTDPEPEIVITEQSYSFQQGTIVYERDEQFTINGTSIRVVMSDGTTSTIVLNDNMIKVMPDMTTAGQKTAVITYQGKDYTITFSVVSNEYDKYSEVINSFLAKFNSDEINMSSISGTASADLSYSFLGDETQINEETSLELTKAQIESVLADVDVKAFDEMYEILLSSIVNDSLMCGETVDFESLTTQVGVDALFNLLAQNIESIDYEEFIIENILKEYRPLFQEAMQKVVYSACFNEDAANEIVGALMDGIYLPYIYGTEIDFQETINDIIATIENNEEYEEFTKIEIISFLETIRDYEFANLFSNYFEDEYQKGFIKYLKKVVETWQDLYGNEYAYSNYLPVEFEDETPEQTQLRELYIETFISTIRIIENIYQSQNLAQTVGTLISNLNAMYNLDEQMRNEWSYSIMGDIDKMPEFYQILPYLEGLKLALDGDVDGLNEYLQASNQLSFYLAKLLTELSYNDVDYTQSYEDVEAAVEQYFNNQFDLLISTQTFDVFDFIDGLQEILGTLNENEIITNFETYGSPMLLSYFLEQRAEETIQNATEENRYPDPIEYQAFVNGINNDKYAISLVFEPLDMLFTFDGTLSFNVQELANLETGIHELANYIITNHSNEYDDALNVVSILTDNQIQLFTNRLLEVVTTYKQQLSYVITGAIGVGLGMEYDEQVGISIENWASDFLEAVINNQVNETTFDEIFQIIDANGNPERKAILYSTIALVTFFMDDIDYNALFANVDLPEQIEDLNFNILVAQLKNAQTYDIFDLSDVQISLQTNELGEITSETLTLTLNIEFNVLISQILGEFTLEFVINY